MDRARIFAGLVQILCPVWGWGVLAAMVIGVGGRPGAYFVAALPFLPPVGWEGGWRGRRKGWLPMRQAAGDG